METNLSGNFVVHKELRNRAVGGMGVELRERCFVYLSGEILEHG